MEQKQQQFNSKFEWFICTNETLNTDLGIVCSGNDMMCTGWSKDFIKSLVSDIYLNFPAKWSNWNVIIPFKAIQKYMDEKQQFKYK